MIVLDSLDVTSSNLESLTLTWSFKSDPREDFSNYTIDVYRCEAPSESISEYDLVASGISSTAYSYNDTSVSGLHDPHRTWYYKFKVINSTDSEESIAMEKPSYLHDVSTNRFYKEIIRRKNKVLNRFSGRDMTLLKRRSWGQHCTECWDETLFRIKYDDCDTCNGTGWIDGYFDPILFKTLATSSPKYNQINMFGDWRPSDIMLTTMNFPPLQVRDVIVDEKNIRWMVKSVRTKELKGFVIEQNVQASRISMEDDVYEVDLSV